MSREPESPSQDSIAHEGTALARTYRRMEAVMSPNQVLGRTQAIGCTAVEITQRCNLDCTLCYLSEHSESVRDLPLEVVLRRLDTIRSRYGAGTHVQITGGEPTLRKTDELALIVRHARKIGLYPALFTNGIAASRRLLERLATEGLCDVAFHVDTTQQRPGFVSEESLNAVRRQYLERASGLGLMVIFNTTIHDGNVREISGLVRFFATHADTIGFASFQLQANTGRSVWGVRGEAVSLERVRAMVDRGAGTTLPWDVIRIGHPRCHSYVPTLVVNGRCYPVVDDADVHARFLRDFGAVTGDRHSDTITLMHNYARALLRRPDWILRGTWHVARLAWRARADLIVARGRVHKLSLFVHDFMDAANLDPERIAACSFMVMTDDGPVSMCEHNARRDEFILKPLTFLGPDGRPIVFQPLRRKQGPRRDATAAGA